MARQGSSFCKPAAAGPISLLCPQASGTSDPGRGPAAGSVSPCVYSLAQVGPSCFLPSFVYQALLTAPLTGEPFGSVWTFFIPCPAGLFLGGTCTVNQVFTFTPDDFCGTNHVFHRLHFLYFNKNGDEKLPTWLLGK